MSKKVNQPLVFPFAQKDLKTSSQSQFIDQYRRVESTLKKIETYEGILLVPAYMGIRYSGRYFVDAITSIENGDREGAEKSIDKATDELRRSRHDALRSLINYLHFKLLLFEGKFGSERIFQVCPEYFDIREKIEAVNTRLNEDFPNIESAEEYFFELENNYLDKLLAVFDRMVRAKSAALDVIKEKDDRDNWHKKLAIAGFGVGLLGLVLAVAAFFI